MRVAGGVANSYHAFRRAKPEETLDYAVMIYRGRFDMTQAAALSRAQSANEATRKGQRGGGVGAGGRGR